MASQTEQELYKIVAKVLNYKRIQVCELTTKRGSQMLYKDLTQVGFSVSGNAEADWSFIKIFQVMFQDQNHMPEGIKVDSQLILDVLASCYKERIFILKDGVNYCELAVLNGGESIVYSQKKRPKTLKISLFKIFSPSIYNESGPEEILSVLMNKAFAKISYTFSPANKIEEHVLEVIREMKIWLPKLSDFKDLIECVDAFLRLLAQRGIKIIHKG